MTAPRDFDVLAEMPKTPNECYRITRETVGRHTRLQFRLWFNTPGGWRPSTEGLPIRTEHLDGIVAMFAAAQIKAGSGAL